MASAFCPEAGRHLGALALLVIVGMQGGSEGAGGAASGKQLADLDKPSLPILWDPEVPLVVTRPTIIPKLFVVKDQIFFFQFPVCHRLMILS